MPTEFSVVTNNKGRGGGILVLQRVYVGGVGEGFCGGGRGGGGRVERRLLDVVKKRISADSTVRGKTQSSIFFFFLNPS
jgi:hypothetical protein